MFSSVAENMNIPFTVLQKKIASANAEVPWQHEQFSKKRILAGTVSGEPAPLAPMARSNIFDRNTDQTLMLRNTKFVAESLARCIYDLGNTPNVSNPTH